MISLARKRVSDSMIHHYGTCRISADEDSQPCPPLTVMGKIMAKKIHDAVTRESNIRYPTPPIDIATVLHQFHQSPRILRMKQLIERTSLSRATLYALMSSDPTFPHKIKLTARSIGFLEIEIDEWITKRPRVRQAQETIDVTNGDVKVAA
jgi:prophage regulatory protein